MKKLLLLVLPILVLLACGQDTATNKKTIAPPVTFSGKIENPKNNQVALLGADDFKQEATLQADGSFSMSFEIAKAGTYSFRHGGERTSVYLTPGDQIQVTLNPDQFDETLTYTGDGAVENNYLVSYYLKNEELFSDYKGLYSLEPVAFKEKMNEIYRQLMLNLNDYHQEHSDMDQDFFTNAQSSLKYEQYSNQLNYTSYHNYYTQEQLAVDDSFYDFLAEMDLNDEKLMEVSNYKNFIKSYLDVKLVQPEMEKDPALKDLPNGRTVAEFKAIDKNFKNESIRNYLLVNSMNGAISYGSLDGIEDLIAEYNQLSSSLEDQEKIKENFDKWSALTKGSPAPNFTGVKTNGEKVSLADLRNKYVYVDVWATWCGPCKREWPYLETIEAAYEGNDNIAFVSISIDEDKAAWEKMVTEKEMGGIQIFTDHAWESTIAKDYIIEGIPRFILIDKDGKILDARAARPSSDEIKKQLTGLVGEGNYTMMSMK